MIRNEKEYQEAIRRMQKDKKVIQHQRTELKKSKLSAQAIERAMAPVLSFHQQLAEEAEWYENVKRQKFGPLHELTQIGHLLIALRIGSGLSQRDLAECLKVSEAQVSRDERNEYHGISIERAAKILSIFGVHLESKVQMDKQPLTREKVLAGAGR